MLSWKFAAVGAVLATALPAATPPVDYVRDVKPVLKQHCYRCHGPSQQKGGMRADTLAFLREGGDTGTSIKAGDSAGSVLLQAILGTHDDISQMPYKKPPLADREIAAIRAWIDAGATGPASEEPAVEDVHWAFAAPVRTSPPAVKRAGWNDNSIDRFVLARLDKENVAPAPEADRVSLLRRVSLDLTGLPPTPAEVAAFAADRSPDAYARVVERLLASPHYGERWARPWLDVARYADSNGYSIDAPRQIWKYRDWVVNALNRDLPYDRFVIEQLAGDLLPNPSVEQKVATGFNRNTQINQEGGIDPEQFRIESVMDRVNTFGTAFLGLTVSCAQCHDHKFDPILQKEYYQLFAFFNNTVEDGHGKNSPGGTLAFPQEIESADGLQRELDETRAELERFLNTHGSAVTAWVATLDMPAKVKFGATAREALEVPWEKMTLAHKRALYALMPGASAEFRTNNAKLGRLERREPKPITTLVMQELPAPRKTVTFIKGDFTRPGDPVTPGTPKVLPPLNAATPTRLDLAQWLFNPKHPLTARVMVNRVWQQYFGRGLVETENDFGTQGIPPTHPELLDYLATEFVARHWSLKALHRLIVNSATYRQSSRVRPDLEIVDPLNKLYARQSRLRLDAEIVRDVALATSGLLVPTLGGPPVYPPQPDGVMKLGQVKRDWTASSGDNRYRRGLYTHFWRATPHPALAVFDAADGFSACTRRLRSNTPLQALTLLNDRQFFEFAGALAKRIQNEGGPDDAAKITLAFKLCVARAPSADEVQRLAALLRLLQSPGGNEPPATPEEAWTTVARVLLNLDEMITRE
ncbi:PSD1 and planctomycete cytochrome C domain-containing protein [Horticoccus sp. 23ND18S-11]|uniref:PSD1 and planctomycete cytochrome C domain-containing protein n=1 Tax=Horticoccus sp. 23ND18S-11 TaxID=3391832 RepID=UPI0039C990D2